MNISRRIGCFMIMVGAVLVGLFAVSQAARAGQAGYLLIGLLILVLGFVLWWRARPAPAPSGRFSMLRRKGNSKKQSEEEQ